MRRHGVDELGEAGLVFQQGGDVVEENPGLGEVRNGADKRFKGFDVHRVRRFAHRSIIRGAPGC